MQNPQSFMLASDNASGVHPNVLASIADANMGHCLAYGQDPYTLKAEKMVQDLFSADCGVFFVMSGTAANVIGISAMLQPYQSVLASDQSHLDLDECGALERLAGHKIETAPSQHGKINLNAVEATLEIRKGQVHHTQTKVLSITQSTEYGTVYSFEELKDIAAFCKKHSLYLHMDGARFANAVASLDCDPKDLSVEIGLDMLTFGGTKNGLLMAEAIVVLNPQFKDALPFLRKQAMQLASKHRFLSAQFIAYLENDLWLKNASQANSMAQYLAKKLAKIAKITITQPVEANAVFAKIPKEWNQNLQECSFFHVWNPIGNEVRMITSFDTQEKHIDHFVNAILHQV